MIDNQLVINKNADQVIPIYILQLLDRHFDSKSLIEAH